MTKKIFFIIGLLLLCTTIVWANSMPIYMSEYPSFNISPMQDCPIEIQKEVLTIDINEEDSTTAMVTAQYKMINPTDESIELPMIFPFVFDAYSTSTPRVTVNDKLVEFAVKRVGDVNGLDYLKDKAAFQEAIQIEQIINKLNAPAYQMKSFEDDVEVTVYNFDSGSITDGRYEVSYDIDMDKTAVILDGFNGYGGNSDGRCTASFHISKNHKKAKLVVLGEDTVKNLQVATGNEVDIIKEKVVLKDYIIGQLIGREKEKYAIYDDESMANAYSVVAEQMDDLYSHGTRAFHEEDILSALRYKQNLSVMLYQVNFEPNSSLDLEVQYNTNATIDRENSKDFTNTFVYLLNPAKGWAKFGELDVIINMSDASPYIINSSLPLEKEGNKSYTASFEGLPEDDLIFTTYPKEEITLQDKVSGRLSRNYFTFFIALVIVGSVIIGGLLYFIIRKIKKK